MELFINDDLDQDRRVGYRTDSPRIKKFKVLQKISQLSGVIKYFHFKTGAFENGIRQKENNPECFVIDVRSKFKGL